MCVILLALQQSDRYPFIIAANRDEFYSRPTTAAAFWPDAPEILAGRDQLANGTWLGISRSGRFAAVTNHYDPYLRNPELRSRGELVSNFLAKNESLDVFSQALELTGDNYNGYGMIFGDFSHLRYQTNQGSMQVDIREGIHGLSNHFLDSPWPRVEEGKRKLHQTIQNLDDLQPDHLFEILRDCSVADPAKRVESVNPAELPIFVRLNKYGTRCSTVVMVDRDGALFFEERSYDHLSNRVQIRRKFELEIQ